MFERFVAFLKDLPGTGGHGEVADQDDPRVAAAALFIRVMDADGQRQPAEHAELRFALGTIFGLDEADVARLIAAGEDAERRFVDIQGFTGILNRHLDETARRAFVEHLFELVFADREANELEDSIVWRVSQVMGISTEDSERIRRSVASRSGNVEA